MLFFYVLIETSCYGRSYNIGVPLENLDWYIILSFDVAFLYAFINFPFHVLNINVFKQKNTFGSLKELFIHHFLLYFLLAFSAESGSPLISVSYHSFQILTF